jgi:hypothetical protein
MVFQKKREAAINTGYKGAGTSTLQLLKQLFLYF